MNGFYALLVTTLILILTSCTSNGNKGIQYYQFSTEPSSKAAVQQKATLVLKPIKLIGISDQQAIIQIHADHSVSIANFNYWAEHPKHMLYKSAQNKLANQLNDWQVINSRVASSVNQAFELEIHIDEFAGHHRYGGIIAGNWYLFSHSDGQRKLIKAERFFNPTALKSDGYRGLAIALETSWKSLNADIVNELKSMHDSQK